VPRTIQVLEFNTLSRRSPRVAGRSCLATAISTYERDCTHTMDGNILSNRYHVGGYALEEFLTRGT
jgi:hypothetical protein